ncbi:MAG: gamma-glutamyl-gamma-aminobutyrate hydrolase family protein [Actinobacteria bacterium]|nr:gamma-glutamyl-gamma-aminobutyrate hydrolase family protein [Actinomycetota bacterium]
MNQRIVDQRVVKPLIGISGRRWPAETIPLLDYTAMHGEEVDVHLSEYPKALQKAGALPVQLTPNTVPIEIVQRLDGLVMTGGADPDPDLYGEQRHPRLGTVERGRDDWELALIRAALAVRLPMLCVCRGAQLLNIALGGTLVQHLDQASVHQRVDLPRIDRCHTVRVSPGTIADQIYGGDVPTNSLHHQAVGRVGEGVVVTGVAEDGVVEAFELTGRPEVFAVQWHPEMLSDTVDPAFTWLVSEAVTRISSSW